MTSPDYEIAIVGGGPAGAATALFLCAAEPSLAERVVLLDRARFPRDKICAGAIGARADKLLAEIGVRVEVAAAPVRGLLVRAAGRELAARAPGNIGRVVRRYEHDAALLDRVRERGVAVKDGVTVHGLERRAREVVIDTSQGALSARAVIGADGVGSVVRRAIGLAPGELHAQAVEVDTPRCASDAAPDLLSFDLSDASYDGYAWDFPTVVDGREVVCRGVYVLTRGLAERRAERDAGAILRERLAARGFDPALPMKRFAERGLSLYEPTAADRVLLVGEAAGIDPVLGEGIPQAIFHGQAAAQHLLTCRRAGDYRFTGYRRALARTRVGVDLRIRSAALRLVYGRTRPWIERWVTRSHALAAAGMCYFAGEHVPRTALARASADLVLALAF